MIGWVLYALIHPPTHPPTQNNRGSELQNYFSRILENNLKALIKPQYVDHIPKAVKGKVNRPTHPPMQKECI